jgi:hypothetical protein
MLRSRDDVSLSRGTINIGSLLPQVLGTLECSPEPGDYRRAVAKLNE